MLKPAESSMTHVNKAARKRKAAKPHPDFPLFRHATGRWCKKVLGKFHYFGKVADDPQGQRALDLWLAQKDDLLAGRHPRTPTNGLTVRDLCNRFLTVKQHLVDTRELSPRSRQDYHGTCALLVGAFAQRSVVDLTTDDFEQLRARFAAKWGPVRLANTIQRVRSVFRYAYEAGLIDRPVRFGPEFKRPGRRIMRQSRLAAGARMFQAHELRTILAAASQPLRAMILLGLNCGFGNHDVGTFPINALDLGGGSVDFPRPKTALPRHCPLWPETVAALREASVGRPEPKNPDHAGLMFITKHGAPWAIRLHRLTRPYCANFSIARATASLAA